MKNRESLRTIIESIVDKQISHCQPPEVFRTYQRLTEDHEFTDNEARLLISKAIQVELFRLMHFSESFNKERYMYNLAQLPDLPSVE